ncbi:helix-turn-helix transcriptional regulator [Aeribacillus pallidus]|nr:helix-turn-helix transcriptional regulator [Aeribacillus pallidus]
MKRERLSRLIKQSGRAKKELAEELGISTQMLNALIRGNRNPSLELAKKIADVLDSSIEELFF